MKSGPVSQSISVDEKLSPLGIPLSSSSFLSESQNEDKVLGR